MNFFGAPQKKIDPAEEAKTWKRNLAKEGRRLERDIMDLNRAEKKALLEYVSFLLLLNLYFNMLLLPHLLCILTKTLTYRCKKLAKMNQMSSAR